VADEQLADDPTVEWGVLVWAPDREPYVLTAEDREGAVHSLEQGRRVHPEDVRHLACRRVSPWQRAGEPLPDLVAPPAPEPERPSLVCLDEAEATGPALSPDCRDGKCTACVGEAWDERADELSECEHPCHQAACARCNPANPTPHRPGTCADRGPWGTTCTEDPMHRYSHYDAGDDSSWQDDWRGDCERGHVPPDDRP